MKTVGQLFANLPTDTKSIIHSDRGWHYQQKDYRAKLKALDFIPNMPRKRELFGQRTH